MPKLVLVETWTPVLRYVVAEVVHVGRDMVMVRGNVLARLQLDRTLPQDARRPPNPLQNDSVQNAEDSRIQRRDLSRRLGSKNLNELSLQIEVLSHQVRLVLLPADRVREVVWIDVPRIEATQRCG